MNALPKRNLLLWMSLMVGLLAFTAINCSSDDPAPNTPAPDTLSAMEQAVHEQVNQYRISQGLAALSWNETVADFCRTHSLDMASGAVPFGHEGFSERIDGIAQTVAYSSAAENVAYNNYADPASAAVDGWLDSPGHLANIEGDFDLTGVGVAESDGGVYYFTQIFIRRYRLSPTLPFHDNVVLYFREDKIALQSPGDLLLAGGGSRGLGNEVGNLLQCRPQRLFYAGNPRHG